MKIKFLEKKTICILSLLATLFIGCLYLNPMNADVLPANDTIMNIFPDSNLASKVAKQLNKVVTDEVSQADLDQISTLLADRANIQNLSGIQYLNHLTTLNLEVNNISDISLLSGLTQLRNLNLFQNKVTDISSLSNLIQLQSVNLSFNSITSLVPLSTLPSIVTLDVSNNASARLIDISGNVSLQTLLADANNVSDVSVLQSLVNLQHLSLRNNQLVDVSPLGSLTNIQRLHLDTNQIVDIAFLSTLTQLRELSISANKIQDISVVSSLTSLIKLQISTNPIVNLEPVRTLVNLKQLEMNVTGISNISAVEHLTQLNFLSFNLNYNQVTDLRPVQNLVNLTTLQFNGNAIEDLTPLQNLTKLQALWMTGNQIQSLEPIVNIVALQDVYFNYNKISSIDVLTRMNTAKLKIINGGNNYITDISPLSSITNQFTSIIYFKDQRVTLDAQSTQRTSIETPNVSIDLDGITPIQSFEALSDGVVTTRNQLLINGLSTPSGMAWDTLALGEYTSAYKVVKTERFRLGTLYYSLLVDQDISVLAPYRVAYDSNGGDTKELPIDERAYIAGENAVVLSQGTMKHPLATFVEWNTEADGSGEIYQADDLILNLQGDVILYAMWKPNPIVITPPTIKPSEKVKDKVVVYAESTPVETGDESPETSLLSISMVLSLAIMLVLKVRKSEE